jgi:DNA-binding NtrC family response regulator
MRLLSRSETASHRIVTVLLVSPWAEDHESLGEIFAHTNWRLTAVSTLDRAISSLRSARQALVICEQTLQPGTWKDLLSRTIAMPSPPLVLVTGLNPDDRLWAEALNLGAYDVLPKPFDRREVVQVVGAAWLQWRTRLSCYARLAEERHMAAFCG